jgi:hypothetical protein
MSDDILNSLSNIGDYGVIMAIVVCCILLSLVTLLVWKITSNRRIIKRFQNGVYLSDAIREEEDIYMNFSVNIK